PQRPRPLHQLGRQRSVRRMERSAAPSPTHPANTGTTSDPRKAKAHDLSPLLARKMAQSHGSAQQVPRHLGKDNSRSRTVQPRAQEPQEAWRKGRESAQPNKRGTTGGRKDETMGRSIPRVGTLEQEVLLGVRPLRLRDLLRPV